MSFDYIQKWRSSFSDRLGLDVLLGQAPLPSAPLRERLRWFQNLVNWVRTIGVNPLESGSAVGKVQNARLKYILQVMANNVGLKSKIAETLRSIIHDTRALELFMHVGIPNQESFLGELLERLNLKLLPQAPHDGDLVFVFSETFKRESDAQWLGEIDPPVFQEWINLFQFSTGKVDPGWNTVVQDAREAIYLLGVQARALGLSRSIRHRVETKNYREIPFFFLLEKIDNFLNADTEGETGAALADLTHVIANCFRSLEQVHAFFRTSGTSVSLIYQTVRLEALILRIRTLAQVLVNYKTNPFIIQEFVSLLVDENLRARSFRGFFKDNIVLISQKIVETNAETGEHYISRTRDEYLNIFRDALGGGFITGFTILFKFFILQLNLAPFVSGFFQSLNYALSFLLLQASGFTLATKQPAMTATTLASKIPDNNAFDPLIDEIFHLVRSQMVTVTGNLWGVIPTIIAIDYALALWGSNVADLNHAKHTIESFSILGMTPFYAAITGVLLWISSVFAGWFYNWFCHRGLPEAIEHQSNLVYVLGAAKTKRIAEFLKRNVAGIASSVSLGVLLGMTPQLGVFFGLPLDVRHITLSTGSLVASAWVIGPSIFSETGFWLALSGLLSMAVLNIAVSFGLALTVAIWSKGTTAPKRSIIYRALRKKILAHPWVLFVPPR